MLMSEQTTLNALGIDKATIEEMFNLYGYVYKKEGADFTYLIQIQEPEIIKNEKSNYSKTTKSSDGKSTTSTVYKLDIQLSAYTTI